MKPEPLEIRMSTEYKNGEVRLSDFEDPTEPQSRRFFITVRLSEPFSIKGLGVTQEEVDTSVKLHIIKRLEGLIDDIKNNKPHVMRKSQKR